MSPPPWSFLSVDRGCAGLNCPSYMEPDYTSNTVDEGCFDDLPDFIRSFDNPPEPPLEEMWRAIEIMHFDSAASYDRVE